MRLYHVGHRDARDDRNRLVVFDTEKCWIRGCTYIERAGSIFPNRLYAIGGHGWNIHKSVPHLAIQCIRSSDPDDAVSILAHSNGAIAGESVGRGVIAHPSVHHVTHSH